MITPQEYIKAAKRTESAAAPLNMKFSDVDNRLLHAAMGLCTESGEMLDGLKKCFFYGKPSDRVNMVEELGDLLWYIAIACDALGVTFEEVMERNKAKLKKRFPNKFTEEHALFRNLDEERKELEAEVLSINEREDMERLEDPNIQAAVETGEYLTSRGWTQDFQGRWKCSPGMRREWSQIPVLKEEFDTHDWFFLAQAKRIQLEVDRVHSIVKGGGRRE